MNKIFNDLLDLDKLCLENSIEAISINEKNFRSIAKKLFEARFDDNCFRGVSSSIQLLPSLVNSYFDSVEKKLGFQEKYGIRDYEFNLINHYMNLSIQKIPYYANPIDLLASAQHFGLPTRLIDWTYDPFVSLYFAVNRLEVNQSAFVLSTKVKNINQEKILEESAQSKNINFIEFIGNNRMDQLKTFFDTIDRIGYTDGIRLFNLYGRDQKEVGNFYLSIKQNKMFLLTNNANPRIEGQKGLFQVFSFQEMTDENFIQDANKKIIRLLKCCKLYKIDFDNKDFILEQLEKLKINQMSLFNDLDNLTRYVNNIVR